MNIYSNMAYKAPSSMKYMGMSQSELRAAAEAGDEEAAGELARRRANAQERGTYGRYLEEGEVGSAPTFAAGFQKAGSESHRGMTSAELRAAAASGDAAATAELARRAHNRASRRAN
jgi:hypothetical protein